MWGGDALAIEANPRARCGNRGLDGLQALRCSVGSAEDTFLPAVMHHGNGHPRTILQLRVVVCISHSEKSLGIQQTNQGFEFTRKQRAFARDVFGPMASVSGLRQSARTFAPQRDNRSRGETETAALERDGTDRGQRFLSGLSRLGCTGRCAPCNGWKQSAQKQPAAGEEGTNRVRQRGSPDQRCNRPLNQGGLDIRRMILQSVDPQRTNRWGADDGSGRQTFRPRGHTICIPMSGRR